MALPKFSTQQSPFLARTRIEPFERFKDEDEEKDEDDGRPVYQENDSERSKLTKAPTLPLFETTGTTTSRTGLNLGAFGGVALFAVIFYASGIPKLKKDVLQKLPVIGDHFVTVIPPSDNPF
ncbi:glucosyltransferase [Diatrype stigma]|uniref:Glucosyltransferase n=1 Tax=Diatrype stigma TaxID=117547 RepID=A0AAN9UQ28_9PEZI